MGGQQSVPVEEQAFNLKFTAKQMTRLSDKIYKKAEKEKEKIKTAIAANNIEGMQDYAEDSIRKKDEALKKKEEELKAQLKNKGALFPYSTLVLVSVRLRTPRRRLSTPLLTPLKSPHPIHPERRPCF